MTRRQAARVAAPGVFLLGVTVAVLLVRAGLETPRAQPAPASVAAATTRDVSRTTTTKHRRHRAASTTTAAAGARYVTVQRGDSFYAIASRAGISLDRLKALNPGVSPYSIRVGDRIRVK